MYFAPEGGCTGYSKSVTITKKMHDGTDSSHAGWVLRTIPCSVPYQLHKYHLHICFHPTTHPTTIPRGRDTSARLAGTRSRRSAVAGLSRAPREQRYGSASARTPDPAAAAAAAQPPLPQTNNTHTQGLVSFGGATYIPEYINRGKIGEAPQMRFFYRAEVYLHGVFYSSLPLNPTDADTGALIRAPRQNM